MTAKDLYTTEILDGKSISFRRAESGVLAATIDGTEYEEVSIARMYPLTYPDRYILVTLPKGEEIGVIDNLRSLSPDAQREADHELKLRYVVPLVTHIRKITQEPGMWRWDIATDRGDMRLLLPNLHDHVQSITEDRLMINDLDGRRCEVRLSTLDRHSQNQLRKVQ